MRYSFAYLQQLLDTHYLAHNTPNAISEENPDPLLEVYRHTDSPHLSAIALVCALFAYGNVRSILRFLRSLDFRLLHADIDEIAQSSFPYYRFQTSDDVRLLFLALRQILSRGGLESIAYNHATTALDSIQAMITALRASAHSILHDKRLWAYFTRGYCEQFVRSGVFSHGFGFVVGNVGTHSPLKRWNMFLRWLVRKDCIDLGIWADILPSDKLLLPLDTHTLRVTRSLGLLQRSSYDIRAVFEASHNLARFHKHDPIRYDFALYRIGQTGVLSKLEN